jgi:hypothetical protein
MNKTRRIIKINKNKRTTKKMVRKAPTHVKGRSAMDDLKMSVPLFPASARKKLMYYEPGFSISTTAGVIGQYYFTANGLYDVNITGTGHQPLGFDTMMIYYDQYTVVGSKITLRVVNNGINAVSIGLDLAPDTVAIPLPDVIENGLVITRVIDGRAGTSGNGCGERICKMNLNCDVAMYFGRAKNVRDLLDDNQLYGNVGANPTEQVYYHISEWAFGGLTDNTQVFFDVVIEYDVIFWEPRKVAAQLVQVCTDRGLKWVARPEGSEEVVLITRPAVENKACRK